MGEMDDNAEMEKSLSGRSHYHLTVALEAL
jgi:hypothetical protein